MYHGDLEAEATRTGASGLRGQGELTYASGGQTSYTLEYDLSEA